MRQGEKICLLTHHKHRDQAHRDHDAEVDPPQASNLGIPERMRVLLRLSSFGNLLGDIVVLEGVKPEKGDEHEEGN